MAGTLTISTLSDGTNSTSATNCVKGSARAWINYNGSTATINNSYNVSSVTVVGTGQYRINFTNAMANANYAVACIVTDDSTANRGINLYQGASTAMTASNFTTTIFPNQNPTAYCAIVMAS